MSKLEVVPSFTEVIQVGNHFYELVNGNRIAIRTKVCACGVIHNKLPQRVIKAPPFYYFECSCKSTLVIKIENTCEKEAA